MEFIHVGDLDQLASFLTSYEQTLITIFIINQQVDYYKSCMPSDWLSDSLSIGDRLLVAKEVDFQIQNNCKSLRILPRFQFVSLK